MVGISNHFVPHSTDIISVSIAIAVASEVALLLYIYWRHNERIRLRNFSTKFLNLEKKERERLLEKYLKKDDKRMRVAGGVFLNHYDMISYNLRENLLKDVLKKNIKIIEYPIDEVMPISGNLALNILERHFDLIPQNLRNEIITQSLPKGEKVKEIIAEILAKHFEKFDHDFRNKILSKLVGSSNKNVKFYIANILHKHFDEIPGEISREGIWQLMESDNKTNIDSAMDILFRNFYKIDIFTRDGLLTRYVESGRANKKILEKFLYTYERSIINQKLKKRIMDFIKK